MASHSWALIGPWGKQYSRNPARSTRAGSRPIGTLSLAGGRGGGPPGDHLTLTPQLACGNSVALNSANNRRDSPRERGPNLQACRSKLIQISAAGRHTTVSCFNIPQRAIKSTAARGSIAGTISHPPAPGFAALTADSFRVNLFLLVLTHFLHLARTVGACRGSC